MGEKSATKTSSAVKSTNAKYLRWIHDLEKRVGPLELLGQCLSTCEKMKREFPELELRGGYATTRFGQDIHFWLVCPAGEIVDPTESQFVFLRPGDYEDAGTTDVMQLIKRFTTFEGDSSASDTALPV